MATVSTVIARQPAVFQKKYGTTTWVNWINDLLEYLSGEGFVFPNLDIESGAVVENDIWIDKPSGCREIARIFYPSNRDAEYNWKEVNNRIRLIGAEVDAEESPDTISTFSGFATTSITVNLTDKEEDDYANYLLVITAGTYANRTYVISGNDASGVSTTKLYFLHDLSAALDGTKVTAGYLTAPDYYVMIEYSGTFDTVSGSDSEIPIDDKYERRLVDTYLRWRAEEHVSALSDETAYWENQFGKAVRWMKGQRYMVGGRIRPRYMPGLEQYREGDSYFRKDFESES